MNHLITSLKCLTAAALLVLPVGCASDTHSKENLAIAAGFKVITPNTPAQQARLATLPAGKVSQVNHQGRIYYVLPDLANNQAYVGGAKQYQAYQQLRLAKQLSNDNLMAAEMNQDASMNWGAWGGWGAWGPGYFW